jgi:hypothetical protein
MWADAPRSVPHRAAAFVEAWARAIAEIQRCGAQERGCDTSEVENREGGEVRVAKERCADGASKASVASSVKLRAAHLRLS